MAAIKFSVLLVVLYMIRFGDGLCSSTDYSNKIRKILSQQDKYTVYEGELIFPQNATYPQANPSGIYGGVHFYDPSVRDYGSAIEYSYFLRASNALIFGGCTPPTSVYFSIVSYIMTRYQYINDPDTHYDHLPTPLFASLGAALNHLVWNTSNNGKDNFDSLTTFIQTADKSTYDYIYNLLISNNVSNISSTEINLQSLPEQFIFFTPYGFDSGNMSLYKDDFDTGAIVFRVTLPLNQTEYQQYINTKQTVYMLSPKQYTLNYTSPIIPYEPYIRDTYSPYNYNESTTDYNKTLHQFKDEIIAWILTGNNYHNKTNNTINFKKEESIGLIFDDCDNELDCYGFRCIEDYAWCLGDNRDTWYGNPYGIIADSNNYMIILGIMHSNEPFKQTTYTNIAYYDHEHTPFDNRNNPGINMFEYNGSALIWNKYIKSNISDEYLKNIFVVQLGLKQNCLFKDELNDKLCLNQSDQSLSLGNVNERIYLNPITKTRPNLNEFITSIFLFFDIN